MIDKKNLINEIFQNNPEFKNDKKSIKNLVDFLVENNPIIKPSKKFKENLKLKVLDITDKKWIFAKKITSIAILIQTLWIATIIGFYYYFIWWIDFFGNNKGLINIPKQEIKIDTIKEDNFENLQDNDDNISLQKINNISPKLLNWNLNISQSDDINIKKIEPSINTQINVKNNIEDTQIIDLLWEPENLNNIESWLWIWWWSVMMMKSSIPSFDTISNDSNMETMQTNNNLFSDFCKDNIWELLNIDGLNVCIVDWKECVESDYLNGVCKFKEIK